MTRDEVWGLVKQSDGVGCHHNSHLSQNFPQFIVIHTMAPHSSTLAWKIPWMEEPGGLQSMGSLKVGHN